MKSANTGFLRGGCHRSRGLPPFLGGFSIGHIAPMGLLTSSMANGTLRWWRRKSAKKGKRLASRDPSNDVKVVRAERGDVDEEDEPELDQENDDDDEVRGLDRDREHFCSAWPMVIASGSVSSAWRMSFWA